jgi:GNAT superfamily N-acetyltransferase
MSCRHDLANNTCVFCYPCTGTVVPEDPISVPNLEGQGAKLLDLQGLMMTGVKSDNGAIIRWVTLNDVDTIFDMIQSDDSFIVNEGLEEQARYSKDELVEFINDYKRNWLWIISAHEIPVGFAFAHLMNKNWAVVEILYIKPHYRGMKYGRQLSDQIQKEMKWRKIPYISVSIDSNDDTTCAALRKLGFTSDKSYLWFGKDI